MKKSSSTLVITGIAFALLLSSCAGGGGGGLSVPNPSTAVVTSTPSPGVSAATVPLTIKMVLGSGNTAASVGRKPRFISPSTKSARLIVYPHGSATAQATYIYDLSSTSSLCVGSAPRTCTFNINAPVGVLDFDFELYDQSPVAGAIPVSAQHLGTSVVTQTITSGPSNTITFQIGGIPTAFVLSTSVGPLTYVSEPADGVSHILAITVGVKDVSGNIISGSVSYTSPVSVSLSESGGVGHTVLMINGVASGVVGTLNAPTDSLAVKYDGLGVAGYGTILNVGSASATISPLYATASSSAIHTANGSATIAISEVSAPGSVAYSVSTACVEVTGTPTVGSGVSAVTTITTTAPGGTNDSCTIAVKDVLGTQVLVPLIIATYGPATSLGAPILSSGVSGSCASSIAFTNAGQTATFTMSDPGFAGPFVLTVPTPSVATASATGLNITITSVSGGSETIGILDGFGNSFSCLVGVTTTSGSAN